MKPEGRSENLEQPCQWLVSGVSAGGRLFQAIGKPLLVSRTDGAYIYASDGTRFIDFHNSSGASLLGHNHPAIADAIRQALEMGFFCNHDSIINVDQTKKGFCHGRFIC